MQKQFKYIYNNEEVSREDFERLAKDSFKWFDGDSIVSVPFSSFDSFFTDDYRSNRQVNDHIKEVLDLEKLVDKSIESRFNSILNFSNRERQKNTNSTRHKSQAGETHKEIVGDLEGINRPPSIYNLYDNPNYYTSKALETLNNQSAERHNIMNSDENIKKHSMQLEEKDDVITNSNRGEKETMEYLQGLKQKQEWVENRIKEDKKLVGEFGVKHNKLKPRLDVLINTQFPKALQLIALATEYGNSKYKETDLDMLNFKRVAGGSQTYFDSCARHSTDRNGLDESGLPHIIHAVWSSLAGLELWAEENNINIKEFTENYMKNLQD